MANSNSGDSVVDRIVRLIAAFPDDRALQLSELAHRANLPLTTAHRLVSQLEKYDLLQTGQNGLVRQGLRLWELTNRASPTLTLRQIALPFMEDIQHVLNQNVNLAVLDNWQVLFVERLSRRGSVVNRAKIAGRMPIHISSAGLALMAYQEKNLQSRYLEQFVSSDTTNAARNSVRLLIAETARQGFAQLKGVVDSDTWGIAVPVLDHSERAVASLGVVVPLQDKRPQALVPALQTAARGIARGLNGS